MQTAESIMSLVENKVSANEPMSPVYYLEAAIRVNALSGDVDNQISYLEAELNHIQAEYIKQDLPANKAMILAKNDIDYKKLLELKALKKRIENFLSTSRKRSQISEFS